MHVARKVLPTIAVTSASTMAEALLAVSALSFLGLGPAAPAATSRRSASTILISKPGIGLPEVRVICSTDASGGIQVTSPAVSLAP